MKYIIAPDRCGLTESWQCSFFSGYRSILIVHGLPPWQPMWYPLRGYVLRLTYRRTHDIAIFLPSSSLLHIGQLVTMRRFLELGASFSVSRLLQHESRDTLMNSGWMR